jgi:hypothetical protein
MLHILFMAAQLWGSWNFYKMYQRQVRFLKTRGDIEDQAQVVVDEHKSNTSATIKPVVECGNS